MLNNVDYKKAGIALLFLGAMIWYVILYTKKISLYSFFDSFSEIPSVAGYLGFIVLIFIKWGWKIPWLQGWFVLVPNLNGTWEGTLQTTWVNPETGETPGPIRTLLVIKQDLLRISCTQYTKESKSYSKRATIQTDEHTNDAVLSYSYSNTPRPSVNFRSSNHDGACSFNIINSPTRQLIGRYFTDRKTTGELNLTFLTRDHKQFFE